MIILLTLLYTILASGGYLDDFGSLGSFGTGLFGFQNDNDSTTVQPITMKPIVTTQKKLRYVYSKPNKKRKMRMRHFTTELSTTRHRRTTIPTRRIELSRTKTPKRTMRPIRTESPTSTRSPIITTIGPMTQMNNNSDEVEIVVLTDLSSEQTTQLDSGTSYSTTDIPLQSNYVSKYIDVCPDEGYFFKKDLQGFTETCYLCFCKENGTSVCWQRENKRCDAESYFHNMAQKRAARNRRSPMSFGNLFIGDVARDVLNSNGRKQCKPHEASYSEGCPPVDWCVGCTVCDCNINGRWDCHLLSFCSEDDKKKNKHKQDQIHQTYDPFVTPKTHRADRQKAQAAVQNLAEKMAQARQKKKIGKSNTRRFFFKNGTLVNKTIFDMRKIKKSPSILNQTSEEVQKWSNLNMKIRKIPDQIMKQMLIDKQQNNAKRVSESANFLVRNMPNVKTRQNMEKKQAQAVNVLAQRKPTKKRKRQVVLPPGIKIPKEILDKLPAGFIPPSRDHPLKDLSSNDPLLRDPPSRDPPGDHYRHVKRVLRNRKASMKPLRYPLSHNNMSEEKLFERSFQVKTSSPAKVLVKRSIQSQKASRKVAKPTIKQLHGQKRTNVNKNIRDINNTKKKLIGLKEKSKLKTVDAKPRKNSNNNTIKKKDLRMNKNAKNNKNVNKEKVGNNNMNKKKDNNKIFQNHKRTGPKNDKNTRKNLKVINLKNNKDTQKGNKKDNLRKISQNSNKNKPNNPKSNDKKRNNVNNKKNVNNKTVTRSSNGMLNKKQPTVERTKTKRANDKVSYKNVKEGNVVIKTATNKRSNGPDLVRVKKSVPREPKIRPKIDQKQLDEEVRKLTGNIQTNLNRKVLEAVEQMLGKSITGKSRKVKRSVPLDIDTFNVNLSHEDHSSFIAKKIKRQQMKQNLSENEAKHLSLFNINRQRPKRNAPSTKTLVKKSVEEEYNNESRHIPFIVKKRPLPPVKHIDKRQIDHNQMQKSKSNIQSADRTDRLFQELFKYGESAKALNSPGYLTTDKSRSVQKYIQVDKNNQIYSQDTLSTKKLSTKIPEVSMTQTLSKIEKRSVPLIKKLVVKKSKRDKEQQKSYAIPVKKSKKISLEKSNKFKLHRQKRNTNEKQNAFTNLGDIENEISTDVFQDVHHIRTKNKFETTDSIFKYYKYTIDDITNISMKPTDKDYLPEILEVDTKNIAAKRSVDKQIQQSPSINITKIKPREDRNDTVSVQGLEYNLNQSTWIAHPHVIEKNATLEVNKLKVYAAELRTFKPTDILDDEVVIVYDQNTTSVESRTEPVIASLPTSTFMSDLVPNVNNRTIIEVRKENIERPIKSNVQIDQFYATKVNAAIEISPRTQIDTNTVIVMNHNNSKQVSEFDRQSKLATENSLKSYTYINTPNNVTEDTSLILPTGKNYKPDNYLSSIINNPESSSERTTITSQSTTNGKIFAIVTEKAVSYKNIQYKSEVDSSLNIGENISEGTLYELPEENNRHFLESPLANNKTSQYNVNRNGKKLSTAEKLINNSDTTSTKIEITTEQMKHILTVLKQNLKLDQEEESKHLQISSTENKKSSTKILTNEIEVNNSESTWTANKVATENKKNNANTLKPRDKDYLKYEVEPKTYNLNQNFTQPRKPLKHKKAKKQRIQEDTNMNNTVKLKPKHRIDDHVVIIVQKDPHKLQPPANDTKNNNLLTSTIKMNTNLNRTAFNNFNWLDSITLKTVDSNYTTQYEEKPDLNTILFPITNYNLEKNHTNDNKQQVKSYDIKKLNFKNDRKYKLKKILTTLHNKTNKDEKLKLNDNVNSQKNLTKTSDLKSFFKSLLNGIKFKKGVKKPSKVKRYKILKYLQKFFKSIFNDKRTHKKNKTIISQMDRKNVIETLCATFGPCNINIKNKVKLQFQINNLNSETYKMLRSVKIIKGLLKLVDMAKNDKKQRIINDVQPNFKSDVQKLHAILKDTYSNDKNLADLTDTQKIQIQYIKNCTQNFIQSAAKFTMLLNDIINLITVPEHEATINEDKSKIERKEKSDTKKLLRARIDNSTQAMVDSNESLQKLKELISKYSLIQNTFMRKIYNLLTNLDGKENKQNKVTSPSSISNVKGQNKTEEIQVYTKNIIQNLRKLKNLAQNLNGNVRRKRDLRDDDSIEYLLMLMEYLLKQNHPLDTAPVNDGIDLLIEAIKNAPDIKTIKKKVLPLYKHPQQHSFRTANLTFKSNLESSEIDHPKDSASDADSKPSKEDNSTASNMEEPKFNAIGQSVDDEPEEEDYYMYNRRSQMPTKNDGYSTITKGPSSTTEVTTGKFGPIYMHKNHETNVAKSTKAKLNEADINENGVRETKLDFFNKQEEQEAPTAVTIPEFEITQMVTVESSTLTEATTETTIGIPMRDSFSRMRYFKGDDDVSASKSRIDWLDETYEEEIKAEYQKSSSTTEKQIKYAGFNDSTTEMVEIDNIKVSLSKHPKIFNDADQASNEVITKGRRRIGTTKEIMYKKEMDLLNSLDYGTEKTEVDVSGSKESGSVDKYAGEV